MRLRNRVGFGPIVRLGNITMSLRDIDQAITMQLDFAKNAHSANQK